jgi:1-acyl-sn-glycerol-3-phosphate acyltransferase
VSLIVEWGQHNKHGVLTHLNLVMHENARAIAVLAAIAASWLAWMVVVLARRPLTPTQNLLLFVNRLLTSLLWRTSAPSDVPLPPGRGGVIVCNHRSSVDPFFVQRSTQRPIHWMVAREYVEHPALRWFLTTCEVIPVNRGGIDTAATKIALRYVRDDGVIGMFPEGRINRTNDLFIPVRPGAALVAIKTRAIVLPCYLEGAPYAGTSWSPLFIPARVTVRYADTIDAADYAARIEAGEDEGSVTRELLMRTLQAIAVLAGQAEFQPRFAGRDWNKKATPST